MHLDTNDKEAKRYYLEHLNSQSVQELHARVKVNKTLIHNVDERLASSSNYKEEDLKRWRNQKKRALLAIPIIEEVIAGKAMESTVVS